MWVVWEGMSCHHLHGLFQGQCELTSIGLYYDYCAQLSPTEYPILDVVIEDECAVTSLSPSDKMCSYLP